MKATSSITGTVIALSSLHLIAAQSSCNITSNSTTQSTTQAPLTSCVLTTTAFPGATAASYTVPAQIYTYCSCGDQTVGIDVAIAFSTAYTYCAQYPYPTVAIAKAPAANATFSVATLPSSATGSATYPTITTVPIWSNGSANATNLIAAIQSAAAAAATAQQNQSLASAAASGYGTGNATMTTASLRGAATSTSTTEPPKTTSKSGGVSLMQTLTVGGVELGALAVVMWIYL